MARTFRADHCHGQGHRGRYAALGNGKLRDNSHRRRTKSEYCREGAQRRNEAAADEAQRQIDEYRKGA